MKRTSALVVSAFLCLTTTVVAQSPEQAVQKANEALLAASKAVDKAAYSKIAGDDLRWVGSDGSVSTKSERLSRLTDAARTSGRIFRDADVKVYGNVAVLMCRSDWTENGKKMSERVQRVFVNRNGQWQLVSHSTTPMDPTK